MEGGPPESPMRPASLLAAALLGAASLSAQFWSELANPRVEVRLLHPPDLGISAPRVAFAPGGDADSRDLIHQVVTEMVRGGRIEVVDPGRVGHVLRDLGPGARSGLDPATLEGLHRALGPAAYVVLDIDRMAVTRSTESKESKDGKGVITVTRTAKAALDFIALLQAADLGQGRVLAPVRLEAAPAEENTSTTGAPAFPRDGDLRQAAFAQVKARILRLLLPWDEELKLTFFDDDKYRMDQAAKAARDKDFNRTLVLAQAGEAEVRADERGNPKYRQRAIYNLGVAWMLAGDLDRALPFLQEAQVANPDASIFRDGVKECHRARSLKAAYRGWEQQRTQSPPVQAVPPSGRRSVEDRLEELDRLNRKGLLSPKEYADRRAAILREL